MDKYKQTNMTSSRIFIDSEKPAQAVDEFLKKQNACARTSPTSASIVWPTAHALIPANNCRSMDISSRYITPLYLL